jgi:glucans biosynthesis protein C
MSLSLPSKARLDYIDNLRWVMIFLVLGVHTAVTYGHIGLWYYNEPRPVDDISQLVFLTFQCQTQAFFMGFLFLLAGYFTPGAYDRKGFWRFVWDRFLRLGAPSLLYAFVIHPFIGYFLVHWDKAPFWDAYRRFLVEGLWMDAAGPMWFAVALLAFSLFYAIFRLVAPGPRKDIAATKVTLAGVILLGLVIAAIAYAVRTTWWIGTHFHTFQFSFFTQYVVLFVVGMVAFRRQWFAGISKRLGYGLLAGAVVLSPVAWAALLVFGGLFQQGFRALEGHGTWQSGAYALWESLLCVALCAGLLVLFRERFNGKGRVAKLMSDNAFGIYVFHPPVLVAISLAFASLALPPLEKWLIVWPLAFLATLAAVHFVARRTPFLKRIL